MTRGEPELAPDRAAGEGRNPGLDDAGAFRAAGPEGSFVAEADGAPVAALSAVDRSDAFAFLGLYPCPPAHRGRGVGEAGLARPASSW